MKVLLLILLFVVSTSLGPKYVQAQGADLPWDHPEMETAVAKARRGLPTFWRKHENPAPDEINFSVQVEFRDGPETEHLWLLMIERENSKVSGTIGTEPHKISGIKYGDHVTISEERITDWSYSKGGKLIGYETIRPLMKRMPPKQVKAWERLFSGSVDAGTP